MVIKGIHLPRKFVIGFAIGIATTLFVQKFLDFTLLHSCHSCPRNIESGARNNNESNINGCKTEVQNLINGRKNQNSGSYKFFVLLTSTNRQKNHVY